MSLPNCSLIVALLLMASTSRAADEVYDLRGPAPKKGLVTRDALTFSMKNADIAIDAGNGLKLEGKMDMKSVTEKEEEVLGVLSGVAKKATVGARR